MRTKRRRPIVVLFLILVIGSGFLLLHIKESDSESVSEPSSENLGAMGISERIPLSEIKTTDGHSHILASDVGIQSGNNLSEQMRWDDLGLEVEVHPDGSESIHLDGRFTHFSAAFRDENGEIQIQCFSGSSTLTDAINGNPPTRANVIK